MNSIDVHSGHRHNGLNNVERSTSPSPTPASASPSPQANNGLYVQRQRSTKFSLYPSRPRTSSREHITRGGPPTPITPVGSHRPSHQRHSPPRQEYWNLTPAQRPATAASHYPSNDDSSRPIKTPTSTTHPPTSHVPHSIQKRPSEASRLRALNNEFHQHTSRSPDGRRTPDRSRTPENFSRPRAPSIKRTNDPPKPLLQNANTFPLQIHGEEQTPAQWSTNPRERGLSTSSSQSNLNTQPSVSLRASSSIPDYHAPDSIYTRQRNLNSTNFSRPARGHQPPESNYAAPRRDPVSRSNGYNDEEVRTSFRSALTTSSSYIGTSGTERSSVMTRSSSATSIYARDEGMSVDDAIGMYYGGFVDSEVEDHNGTRPPTASSEMRRGPPKVEEAPTGTLSAPLSVPTPKAIIRDSTAIFQSPTHMVPEETSPVSPPPQESFDVKTVDPESPSQPKTRTELPKPDASRDRYGFKKRTQHTTIEQYDAWNGPYTEYLARRRKKWVALLKENNMVTQNPMRFPAKSAKVKRFVRKGIPPDWRGEAWFYYAGGSSMIAKHHGVYGDLISKAASGAVTETDNEIIERDLNRTFPDNIKFKPDPPEDAGDTPADGHGPPTEPETPILQSLRRVLQAFSIYNPKIGYCQSLNFLAGLLLLFMDEEKSFWMLNIITRVYLPGTHEVNLEGANVDLGVLMTSIKESMPTIWAKIGGELDGTAGDGKVSMRLPPITLCCTAWFMSCFIGTLPIETTLRVWDSFFLEGSKTLFRIALAIFKVGEQEIRAVSDPMEIFQVVQTIPRRLLDANALIDVCFFRRRNGFGHLSQATIETRRAERRAGYAEERAKANGDAVVLARKGTLFTRRKLKGVEVQ